MGRHAVIAATVATLGLAACTSGSKNDFAIPGPRVFATGPADTLASSVNGDEFGYVHAIARSQPNQTSTIRAGDAVYEVLAPNALTPQNTGAGATGDVLSNLVVEAGGLSVRLEFTRDSGAVVDGVPTFTDMQRVGGENIVGTVRFRDTAVGLAYSTFGDWRVEFDGGDRVTGFGSFGKETLNLPNTGMAVYNGQTTGTTSNVNGRFELAGAANFNVNFATGGVAGNLTGMTATDDVTAVASPFNNVMLTGGIRDGVFVGDAAVANAPGGPAAMVAGTTGAFGGRFYGPTFDEVGGNFTLIGGGQVAVGAFGAKR